MMVLRETDGLILFHCPGCDKDHAIQHGAGSGPRWTWNGNKEKPTFSPSVLVRQPWRNEPDRICHSFVSDGNIQFLGDCTHKLAGQTVSLPPYAD
jgi:hypothetical protein